MLASAPHTHQFLPEAAHDREQDHEGDRAEDEADGEADQLIAKPRSESLRGESVLMLAEVSLVHAHGKLQQERDEQEGHEVEKRLEMILRDGDVPPNRGYGPRDESVNKNSMMAENRRKSQSCSQ